jgi:hypothetical protein
MLRQAMFSALGLLPVACGGSSTGSSGEGGAPSMSGAPSSSGSSSQPTGGASGGASGSAGAAGSGAASSGAAGSGGVSVAGAGGAGGEPSGPPPFPCEGSMPVGGDHPGYSRCGDSYVWHRPAVTECPPSAMPPMDGVGCIKDSDCGTGKICVCGQPSMCADATCTSDADCGAGFVCRGYSTSQCEGPGVVLPNGFACQTTGDACLTHQQCKDGKRCGGDSGTFQCDVGPVNPGCGRPFLVAGAERVAPLCERDDWLDAGFAVEVESFAADVLTRASAAWARIGQLEHASVAAFARFTLQLLQCGAPTELVERATRAAADEVRHARLAFAIASRCAGANLGPASLDVQRSLDQSSLSDVIRLVIREGCVGETIAALQASEAAAGAASPRLRELLERVARDEAEHAELAWRFVRWALERDPELSHVLADEVARARTRPGEALNDDQSLRGLGILSATDEAALRSAALREVIEPCAAALAARVGAASASRPAALAHRV